MNEVEQAKKLAAEQAAAQATQQSQAGKQEAEEKKKEQQEQMRISILASILDTKARERINNIRVVDEPKATKLENMLIQAAQQGKIPGKVDENTIKGFLDQLSKAAPQLKVKFKRNKDFDIDLDNL